MPKTHQHRRIDWEEINTQILDSLAYTKSLGYGSHDLSGLAHFISKITSNLRDGSKAQQKALATLLSLYRR
jgi:hypothetical protein